MATAMAEGRRLSLGRTSARMCGEFAMPGALGRDGEAIVGYHMGARNAQRTKGLGSGIVGYNSYLAVQVRSSRARSNTSST